MMSDSSPNPAAVSAVAAATGISSPKGNSTRRRLLETAWRLFSREGYTDTTLRRIAQEAEVSLGLSYRYFATKEDFVTVLYYDLLQDFEARASELPAGSLAERFERLMTIKLALLQPHRRTLGAVFAQMMSPEHSLGVLGNQTEAIRMRNTATYTQLIYGSEDAPEDALIAEQLGRCLYLGHLGMILLSFLDRSPEQKITFKALSLISDLLGFAGLLLATPLAGGLLARVDEIVAPFLNLSEPDEQQLSEAILAILFSRRHPTAKACADSICPRCAGLHLPRVEAFVKQQQPIHLLLPGFPAKLTDLLTDHQLGSDLPDRAEELALLNLQGLCDEIAGIYPPGARITLCSEGRVCADLLAVDDESVSRYGKALDQQIERLELSSLERFSLDDLYDGVDFDTARDQLLSQYGENQEILKARYPDLLPELVPDWALLQRSQAWSRLLGLCFPQALRLSPQPENQHGDTIGISLMPGAEIQPWQGVILADSQAEQLTTLSAAIAKGARPIRRNRRPSHYSLVED